MKTCALLALAAATVTLAACGRTQADMIVQPRYDRDEASPMFADGRATRPPPSDSVATSIGDLALTSSGRRGRDEVARHDAAYLASKPPRITLELLARGRRRYEAVCTPCHSVAGDGDGMVVRRGFPPPPTYHQARLRAASDRHLFDVISYGYGVMLPYAERVAPEDRWAVVAYIRALQFSRYAPLAQLPPAWRDRVQASDASSAPPSEDDAPFVAQPNAVRPRPSPSRPPPDAPLPPPGAGAKP